MRDPEPQTILESIQESLLLSSMKSMCGILRLLHIYLFHEDAIVSNELTRSTLHSYRLLSSNLQKLIVNAWTLMYLMYQTVLAKNVETSTPEEREGNCIILLSAIHAELGIRQHCKLCDSELLSTTSI